MERIIVKCEVLWTRSCPLKCSYCSMADGRLNSVSLENWKAGFRQLKQLGCSFAAFYGAEPLHDFGNLPEVIEYAEFLGINTTVITSGVVSNLDKKLKELYSHGLRSITASYDYICEDSSSAIKTIKAKEVINVFRSFGPVRDSAVVVTLTRKNYKHLPEIIRDMSKKDIWTFFDLIHPDRHQPGSKVKSTDYDLLFQKEDIPHLIQVLQKAMTLKDKDFKCHTSKEFVEILKLAVVPEFLTPDNNLQHSVDTMYKQWNCANFKCFPSWVTVDCDGIVYPCDDFQPKNVLNVPIWKIADSWEDFSKSWKAVVRTECPGCLWNTHIDSNFVKTNVLPITSYVHGIGG